MNRSVETGFPQQVTKTEQRLTNPSRSPLHQTKELSVVAPTLYQQNGYHESLQNLLTGNLDDVKITKQHTDAVTVLMPLHNAPDRIETGKLVLEGLTKQERTALQVVVADNGVSSDGARDIKAKADALGLPLTFADARPTEDRHRNPAYPRNKGLQAIKNYAAEDPAFRGPVFEIDSDCAPLPNAVTHLKDSLQTADNAVAITADIIPVATLDKQVYDQYASQVPLSGETHALPTLWTQNGKVDLASIVAFSSLVAGKTTGLLIDQDKVQQIIRDSGELYVRMPHASAEDMIAATAFTRHGVIYRNSNAQVLDEARPTPKSTFEQQVRWGRDHVQLAHDLVDLQLLEPGITILEPTNGKWQQWRVPFIDTVNGTVINPNELRQSATDLETLLHEGQNDLVQDPNTVAKLEAGIIVVKKVLELIEAGRMYTTPVDRSDLPAPTTPKADNPRHTSLSRVSRLAGNILGMYDLYEQSAVSNGSLPQVFLFGMRQSATWDK
jgi:hypothetical protein